MHYGNDKKCFILCIKLKSFLIHALHHLQICIYVMDVNKLTVDGRTDKSDHRNGCTLEKARGLIAYIGPNAPIQLEIEKCQSSVQPWYFYLMVAMK